HGTARRLQGRLEQARIEWRVKQHQVHAGGSQSPERADAIAALYFDYVGLQVEPDRLQLHHQLAVTLHQEHLRRTARRRLETQRPGPRKDIDTTPARQVLPQPVEQRLTHAIGRGAQARLVGNRQARALPLAADQAHYAGGRRFHAVPRKIGRRPTNRAEIRRFIECSHSTNRLMFSFFKKKNPQSPPVTPPPEPEPTNLATGATPALSGSTAADSLIGSALVTPIDIAAPDAVTAAAPERAKWLDKLKVGLRKTGSSISSVFTGAQIDEALYEDLEAALLTADTGVQATQHLLGEVRR